MFFQHSLFPLALGPCLMGEANLFPKVTLGDLLASPLGKCLEQTSTWLDIFSKRKHLQP